jgi:hypothetical protein
MALYQQTDPVARKGAAVTFAQLALSDGGLAMSNPGLAIDTNFDIQAVNAFDMVIDGIWVTVAAGADFDTGTVKAVDADKWVAALLSIDADGSTTYVDYGAEAATEALAIAALDVLTPSGEVVVGYVAIKTAAGLAWNAGTDALQGGTGGNVSSDTNYYNVCGWVK